MCESYVLNVERQVERSREFIRRLYADRESFDYARGGVIATPEGESR